MQTDLNKRGFTLIELLVVIAIIMILAAILFPVFERAQQNAERASCQSNMKQIALGFKQYLQDYDGRYPEFYTFSCSSNRYGDWASKLVPYTKSTELFVCPSEEPHRGNPSSCSGFTETSMPWFNYAYNTYLGNQKESLVNKSALVILNWEVYSENRYMQQPYGPNLFGGRGVTFPNDPGSARHFDGANYSFADGHVKWFRPDAVKIAVDATSPDSPTFEVQ